MNTFGLGFNVYLTLKDNIFKKDNVFEIKITNSSGKSITLDSTYSLVTGPEKYTAFSINDSAGAMILSYIIQRKDNGSVMSTGWCTVKYNDITNKLNILDFKETTNQDISLKLVNIDYISQHICFEIDRNK